MRSSSHIHEPKTTIPKRVVETVNFLHMFLTSQKGILLLDHRLYTPYGRVLVLSQEATAGVYSACYDIAKSDS